MAGDWIKMRGNLWDDPRVAKIVDMTDSSEAAVIGALYWLWSTADQHTETGVMPGLTLRSIDRKTGVKGFADALCAIDWIEDHPEGVRIVDFEKHNGSSAKKRCQTAKRVANYESTNAQLTQDKEKTNADSVSTALGKGICSVSDALAREEKRREEKNRDKNTNTTTSVVTPDGVSYSVWADFKKLRASKKAPVTQTAIDGIQREAEKACMTVADALAMCCERGWTGFKAEWVNQQQSAGKPINKQEALEQRNQAVANSWASNSKFAGAI